MTVLLDAYAVVAVLRGEPAAQEVVPLLADDEVVVHPLNLAEVIDRVVRVSSSDSEAAVDADDVEADVALLGIGQTDVVADVLVAAGRLRAAAYHRTSCPVSLADGVAAVQALATGVPLATSDPHLADVVQRRGGQIVALADSTGRRPPTDHRDRPG